MRETVEDPAAAQLRRYTTLCRSMGVSAEDLELYRTDRPAWEKKQRERARAPQPPAAAASERPLDGPRPTGMPVTSLDAALDRNRMLVAMGVSRSDFALKSIDRLGAALDRARRGEHLTAAEVTLVASAAASVAPPPTTAPPPPATRPGRPGTIRMISSAILGETR